MGTGKFNARGSPVMDKHPMQGGGGGGGGGGGSRNTLGT